MFKETIIYSCLKHDNIFSINYTHSFGASKKKKKAQCAGASEAKITNIWQHIHCSQNNMTKSLKSSFQKTTSKMRSKVKGLTKREKKFR